MVGVFFISMLADSQLGSLRATKLIVDFSFSRESDVSGHRHD